MRYSLVFFLLLVLSLSVFAQDNALIDGLNAPRGLFYDSEGNLWIAEAGQGGELTAEGTFGPIDVGGSGALQMLSSDGDLETIIQNLPSQGPAGQARGVSSVMVTDDAIWLLIGEGPASIPLTNSLLKIDRESLRIVTQVDLYTPEAELNPDGDIVSSNAVDFTRAADGTFYIANAGCNCIESWTEGGEVQIFASWTMDDNPVPTSVALAPDGSLYVGFLSGWPHTPGSSRIEQWSTDGSLMNTFSGLTALTDVLVTSDGTIYAVSIGTNGDEGFSNGQVLRVSADGATVLMEGLTMPYALAQAPDGSLVVSVDSVGENGMVLPVPMN